MCSSDLDDIPVSKIKEVETELLQRMHLKYGDVMKAVAASGQLSDELTEALKSVSEDLVGLYTES